LRQDSLVLQGTCAAATIEEQQQQQEEERREREADTAPSVARKSEKIFSREDTTNQKIKIK
jgi:hypothetical protein